MPSSPILVASQLGKRYDGRGAVRDVSFGLNRGEVLALLGPNGAGKTTTLRLLVGLLRPTTGAVFVDGVAQDPRRWPATRSRIGFLTEMPGLWDRLSVEANLLTYARLFGVADPRTKVSSLLRDLELADRAADLAGRLSKGMRQKVALARAVLHDPAIVLLDEPTSGLDPAMTRMVREIIQRFGREGRAVLVATHNLDEAERVADRVAVLEQTLVALDTPAALRQGWGAARVEITLTSPAAPFAAVAGEAGAGEVEAHDTTLVCTVTEPNRDIPAIVSRLVNAGAGVRAVIPAEATLEEAYLAIIRRHRHEAAPESR